MSEFLFIPSESANGGRMRIRINDIPHLFSEGAEDPPPPSPAWQSLRHRCAQLYAAASVRLEGRRDALLRRPEDERTLWRERPIGS